MRPLLYTLVISAFIQFSLQAQISKGDMLWDGQLRFESFSGFNDITANLNPSVHFFISQKFSLGGGLSVAASFGEGIQNVLLSPEIRYYFNPQHLSTNWFVFGNPQLRINSEARNNFLSPFQLSLGGGLNYSIHKNISLESKLHVFFKEGIFSSFFDEPTLFLSSKLVFRLPKQDHWNSSSISPILRRGVWMIGGSNINVSKHIGLDLSQFVLNISPRIGLFLSDYFLIGLGIPFEHIYSNVKFTFGPDDPSLQNITAFGAAPFVRLYPGNWKGRFRPYLEFAASYMQVEDKFSGRQGIFFAKTHFRRLLQGSGGLNIFLSPHIALETGFYLEHNVNQKTNRFGLHWGLQYYLGQPQNL